MWRRVCVWRRVCGTHELRSLRMGNAVILIFVWLLAVTVPRCLGPRQGLGDGDAMSRAKARVGRRTGNIGALQWRRTHGKAPASKRYSAPGMWHPTVTAQCHGNKAGSGAYRVRAVPYVLACTCFYLHTTWLNFTWRRSAGDDWRYAEIESRSAQASDELSHQLGVEESSAACNDQRK